MFVSTFASVRRSLLYLILIDYPTKRRMSIRSFLIIEMILRLVSTVTFESYTGNLYSNLPIADAMSVRFRS
jgi:hypothetical protein